MSKFNNNENIHNLGNMPRPHSVLSTKFDAAYLDEVNREINKEENMTHKTILDHSVREVLNNFTKTIIRIIDDTVVDISELNDNDDDTIHYWGRCNKGGWKPHRNQKIECLSII